MSNKILVIDGNNNLYRAFFKLQKLTSEGKSVSAIYGVTEIVAGLIKKFYPKEVYVVWDGKKRQERIDLLPEYKKREKKPDTDYDDMFRQRNVIQQMLMFLGVNQVYSKDMEADDLTFRNSSSVPILFSNSLALSSYHLILVSSKFISSGL